MSLRTTIVCDGCGKSKDTIDPVCWWTYEDPAGAEHYCSESCVRGALYVKSGNVGVLVEKLAGDMAAQEPAPAPPAKEVEYPF